MCSDGERSSRPGSSHKPIIYYQGSDYRKLSILAPFLAASVWCYSYDIKVIPPHAHLAGFWSCFKSHSYPPYLYGLLQVLMCPYRSRTIKMYYFSMQHGEPC